MTRPALFLLQKGKGAPYSDVHVPHICHTSAVTPFLKAAACWIPSGFKDEARTMVVSLCVPRELTAVSQAHSPVKPYHF